LVKKGFKAVLLNPYQTRRYQQAISNKVKTDAASAFVIADLLRTGRYLASSVPEEKIESLRELMKFQHQQEEQKKATVRRISSILAVVFPEHGETAIANVCNVVSREVLRRWPTSFDIASASVKRIEKLARTIKGNNLSLERIVHLVKTAEDSIYSGRSREVRGLTMKLLIQELDSVLVSLEEIKTKIEEVFTPDGEGGSFPGENLLTIPGVGKKTAASFLAVAGFEGENFPSVVELTGYIGFFPRICQSGKSEKKPVISSQGPRFIRHSLYIAAVSCLRHNLELKCLYNKKVSQGKSPKEALIYVAKKLAHIMLALLKTGEDYRPERVFVAPTALRRFHQAALASL
jgi:transposase